MSKKFKKLLCGILSAAMLFSSISMIGYADADSEITDEVEVTATATPAPTTAPRDYSGDAYYNKALALCQSLGIITGYEDGNVQPDKVVTRAEMATIVLRALNVPTTGSYKEGLFNDVTASHWAAGTIQNAYDQQIINGFDDGSFQPDGDVTATQVQKMLVAAANFGSEAEFNGGYPSGYLRVANNRMSLNKSVSISDFNTGAERGNVIKMVYNALLAPYNELTTSSGTEVTYESKYTWAKVKFDIIEAKGLLEATNTATINSNIKPIKEQISISGTLYRCTLTDLDSIVGSNVIFYYKDSDDGLTAYAVVEDSTNTTTATLDVEDIDSLSGFENGNGAIKMDIGSRTYRMSDTVKIIYNGAEITYGLFNAASGDTTRIPAGTTYDQFLLPTIGTIKIVDNDGDSKYDVMYVDSYQTVKIVSANEKKVTGKAGLYNAAGVATQYNVTIDVDAASNPDKSVKVVRNGGEIRARNLNLDDVASIKRSIDDNYIEIIVTGESITGTARSLTTDANKQKVAIINGDEYVVSAVAFDEVNVGTEGTFYFDAYNQVGRVEATNNGGLTGSEKYGWIMTAFSDESGTDVKVRMYTQDGKSEEFSVADKVNFWGPRDAAVSTLSREGLQAAITDLASKTADNDGYLKLNNATNGTQIRAVKYKTNSKNEITHLYCATPGTASTTTDAFVLNTTSLNGRVASGNLVGGYYMSDGMALFRVPNRNDKMNDAGNYYFGEATASHYLNRENGVSTVFVVGQFKDGNFPQIVIEFVVSSDEARPLSDYGTADDNPVMVVTDVVRGIDAEQNPVYTVKGYSSGGSVEYTTQSNSSIYKLTGVSSTDNGRQYAGDILWDAISSRNENVGNYLKKGDIVGVAGNGGVFLKMIDIDELKEYAKTGTTTPGLLASALINPAGSASRDSLVFGGILQNTIGAVGMIDIGTSVAHKEMECDASRTFDLITINADGSVYYDSEGTTLGELANYEAKNDGTYGYGDMAFMRVANKGSLREIIVFRFDN